MASDWRSGGDEWKNKNEGDEWNWVEEPSKRAELMNKMEDKANGTSRVKSLLNLLKMPIWCTR